MIVTFLGTGTSQGIPVIANNHPVCLSTDKKDNRLRNSILVEWDDLTLVIDCGADFRQQILRENIQHIDGVLFTHEHADHTAGLDDIRQFCYKNGAMPIYGLQRVLDNLERRFYYIFQKENRYPGAPSVIANTVNTSVFEVLGKKIQPIQVQHGKLTILGYRFDNFAYLTDVKSITLEEKEKLKGLDVLVTSALRIEPHPTHSSLAEALALVEELQPKKAYFSHISHLLGFHEEVSKQLPNNVFLAYDGLKIEV